ncbi:hypothetical protein T10_7269 [Trichinella papuae]|uniref:Uncharacterized protein n=1 Tax=Trichinella papuae TaxID=268474 RepID=A0A0V1M0G2_9BILA|nr:hypothetical protein T10_4891 [Trichinella papuae]KRZ72604.1 hypothetical protein T10_7269 [Trichinella papuae]
MMIYFEQQANHNCNQKRCWDNKLHILRHFSCSNRLLHHQSNKIERNEQVQWVLVMEFSTCFLR